MNHLNALQSDPTHRLNIAILQYLKTNELYSTFTMFQEETGLNFDKIDPSIIPIDNDNDTKWLLNSFMYSEENRLKFKSSTYSSDTIIHKQTLSQIEKTEQSLNSHIVDPVSSECILTCSNPIQIPFENGNPTCICFISSNILVYGSVDKKLHFYNISNQDEFAAIYIDSPLISIDYHFENKLLLCGTMSAKHVLVDIQTLTIIKTCHNHKKYVKSVKFSPTNQFVQTDEVSTYTTSSHDGTIQVFKLNSGSRSDYEFLFDLSFDSPIECIEYVSSTQLFVTVREDNYIHLIDIQSHKEIKKINLNLNIYDDHVSFNVLYLKCFHSLLAIVTDSHRIILLHLETHKQINNFYNVPNSGYANPRVCFSKSGQYLFVSSEDKSIHCLDIVSGKTISKLTGHESQVRGMDIFHACQSDITSDQSSHEILVTCSFDKTLRVWK